MVEIRDENLPEQEHPYFRTDAHHQRLLDTDGTPVSTHDIVSVFNALAAVIGEHMEVQGFWDDEDAVFGAIENGTTDTTGEIKAIARRWKNAEKYMLIATELTECIEGDRAGDGSKSDKITGFTQLEEEMADIMVRAFDFCKRRKLRIGEAFIAKMDYNAKRPFRHGKKF